MTTPEVFEEGAILYEAAAGVARITLAESSGENPLNTPSLVALSGALLKAEASASIRAVVISAKGEHFCRGMDLSAALLGELDGGMDSLRLFVDTLLLIRRSRLPVIACIEGKVTGGGLGLTAACDLVLAAPEASFMLPEVILGMIPALITPFLLRRVTPGRIGYMTMSSRALSALEAREIGLVDEVMADGARASLARQLARIGRSAPDAITESKRSLDQLADRDLERQIEAALELQLARLQRPKVQEGVRLFMEGFSPPWFQRIGDAHE